MYKRQALHSPIKEWSLLQVQETAPYSSGCLINMEMEVHWGGHSSVSESVVCSGNQATAPWQRSMQMEEFMCGNLKLDDQLFATKIEDIRKGLLRS